LGGAESYPGAFGGFADDAVSKSERLTSDEFRRLERFELFDRLEPFRG
jgi:hypothetical protein